MSTKRVWQCYRCKGVGTDPYLECPQSCLVCWGQGWIDLYAQVWDHQNAKALEWFLYEYDGKTIDVEVEDE